MDFFTNVEYTFSMTNTDFTNNSLTSCIEIATPSSCLINITGGSYSGNSGGVFDIQCDAISESSSILSAAFSENSKLVNGADIHLVAGSGALNIGPGCTFEKSSAEAGQSISFSAPSAFTEGKPTFLDQI